MICGIDEAGRGPLAGPVTAAAVVLDARDPIIGLDDSKRLSPAQREQLDRAIRERSLLWGIGWAHHQEIDRLNIRNATLLAMRRAYLAMLGIDGGQTPPPHERGGGLAHDPPNPMQALVDGRDAPDLPLQVQTIVGGDGLVPEIQAASILAKVARDRWMIAYAMREPLYRFEQHKGYPTILHRRLIARYGPSAIQRRSFRYSSAE